MWQWTCTASCTDACDTLSPQCWQAPFQGHPDGRTDRINGTVTHTHTDMFCPFSSHFDGSPLEGSFSDARIALHGLPFCLSPLSMWAVAAFRWWSLQPRPCFRMYCKAVGKGAPDAPWNGRKRLKRCFFWKRHSVLTHTLTATVTANRRRRRLVQPVQPTGTTSSLVVCLLSCLISFRQHRKLPSKWTLPSFPSPHLITVLLVCLECSAKSASAYPSAAVCCWHEAN